MKSFRAEVEITYLPRFKVCVFLSLNCIIIPVAFLQVLIITIHLFTSKNPLVTDYMLLRIKDLSSILVPKL